MTQSIRRLTALRDAAELALRYEYEDGYDDQSQAHHADYGLAAEVVAALAGQLGEAPQVSPPYFLNVNVPNEPADKIAGVRITRLGGRAYGESVRTEDSFGHRRYWISRNRAILSGGDGTDITAHRDNYITITPMGLAFSTTDERMALVQGLVERAELLASPAPAANAAPA